VIDHITKYNNKNLLQQVLIVGISSQCFEQDGIIEILDDGHILTQTLSSSSSYHEFSGQMSGCAWFKGSQDDGSVEGIAGQDGPVVKHAQAECLTCGVDSEIGFESKTVNCGDIGSHSVQR